jgi:hypothetical protein
MAAGAPHPARRRRFRQRLRALRPQGTRRRPWMTSRRTGYIGTEMEGMVSKKRCKWWGGHCVPAGPCRCWVCHHAGPLRRGSPLLSPAPPGPYAAVGALQVHLALVAHGPGRCACRRRLRVAVGRPSLGVLERERGLQRTELPRPGTYVRRDCGIL